MENANQGRAFHRPTTASANALPNNLYLKDGSGIDKAYLQKHKGIFKNTKGFYLKGTCFCNSVGLPAGFFVSVWKNTWKKTLDKGLA